MPDLIEVAAEHWLAFSRTPAFLDSGPLKDKIAFFAAAAMKGLRENIPELRDVSDSALLHAIALGIIRSGTHTDAEVEQALGRKLSGEQ